MAVEVWVMLLINYYSDDVHDVYGNGNDQTGRRIAAYWESKNRSTAAEACRIARGTGCGDAYRGDNLWMIYGGLKPGNGSCWGMTQEWRLLL
jgi:hypothetical protein